VQITLLFFGGFLMRFSDIPKYMQWYSYIDFMRYGWGALMISQFKDRDVKLNGTPILEYYDLDEYTAWEMLGYEALFLFVFFMMAWAALQFKKQSQR
jgi:ATP-binding cassette, subfamily G (WHITE), member 2